MVGQAKLVMSERFHQFSGLVDNCEFDRGEKKTTIMDLRGFWEMIYYQVEDVNQKFEALEKQRQSNWIQEEELDNLKTSTPTLVATASRKRSSKSQVTSKATASSGLKALIAAKRKKVPKDDVPEIVVQESDKASEDPCSPEKTFDGGFFKIKSPFPQLTQVSPSRITRSAGQTTYLTTPPGYHAKFLSGCFRTVRRTEVTDSAKRMSGLVSPFVSQLARRSLNIG